MRTRSSLGWLIGILSAAVAAGVGEMVAAFVRPVAAPVIAVGNGVIVLTPEWLKRNAIGSVGSADKPLLILSILFLLAVLGAAVGSLAMRNVWAGIAGITVVGAFGVYCALIAHGSRGSDVVPTIIGTLAAAAVLVALVRVAGPAAEEAPGNSLLPDRRLFVQGSIAAGALAAIAGFGGRAAQHARFDVSAERRTVKVPPASPVPAGVDLGKSGVPWATPTSAFYRIDTALSVPELSSKDWKLRVHGMVDHELTIDFRQLMARPMIDRWITLCCVSNEVGGKLVGNALFHGTRLADLLREAGLQPDCDELVLTSVDGMTIGAPAKVVMDGRDALLAVGMNGEALPIEHGFPVRTVVPGLYGYVSACKWIVDIEATTFDRRRAYWVEEGYSAAPPIELESRIDTPHSQKTVPVGKVLPVAGVAWDQHVGVSKVEVQVNGGPWQAARLAAVPSTDTWRQWVLPWTPPKSGTYTLRVRATDARGQVQPDQNHPPFPGGATGLHTITVHAR